MKKGNVMTSKLDSLKKQREQLTARIQKLEAAEKAKARKEDTRRKILVGAYYLEQAKENNTEQSLYKTMHNYLTRESDKKLFDNTDTND